MGFKMRKGKNTSFKDLGSSPKKQRQILHGTSRPRSIYDERRDAGLSSPESTAATPRQRRFDVANLQENPSDIYSGEVLGEGGWEQQFTPASETQVPIRDRDFDRNRRGKLTRRGKKQMEDYISRIEKRRQDPEIKDLKKDRSQSQLTRGMIERGFSQVQDPYGNWHAMDRRGRLTGSRFNYSPESKAWRDQQSSVERVSSYQPTTPSQPTEWEIRQQKVYPKWTLKDNTWKYNQYPENLEYKPKSSIDKTGTAEVDWSQASGGSGTTVVPKAKKKKGKTWDQAYKDRDKSVYGDLSKEEYVTEAKRQKQSKAKTGKWDAPKTKMKTSKKDNETKEKKDTKGKKTKNKKEKKGINIFGRKV